MSMSEEWQKSSYSADSDSCVEWRKSSFSMTEGGDQCVEVAALVDGVMLRDSKDPDGPVLRFTDAEWRAFICGAAAGEFGEVIPF